MAENLVQYPKTTMGDPLRRVCIGDLTPGMKNVEVIGIIIAKHLSSQDQTKTVWRSTVTIRESSADFVNVTFWMSEAFSKTLDNEYHIGDVIRIQNPKIVTIDCTSIDLQRMNPSTSTSISITFAEDFATLTKYKPPSPLVAGQFLALLFIPTKSGSNICDLSDVHTTIIRQQEEKPIYIDVLVCVKKVFPIENESRANESRNVIVFDHSNSSTLLKIEDSNWVYLADNFTPKKDILFIADVKVDWDPIHRWPFIIVDTKSVVTMNPVTEESTQLSSYVSSVDFPVESKMELLSKQLHYKTIQTITTIEELRSGVCLRQPVQNEGGFITGIVHGLITRIDLDVSTSMFIKQHCVACGSLQPQLGSFSSGCPNSDCPNFTDVEPPVTSQFDLWIDLCDNTGSIKGCRLSASGAESMFGSASDVFKMRKEKRLQLKANFHMKPVKIFLIATFPTVENPMPEFLVLHYQRVAIV